MSDSSSVLAKLKESIETINAHGISTQRFVGIIDDIINGDLTNKDYKKSTDPLFKAADKQKEAERIIMNYKAASSAVEKGIKNGEGDDAKNVIKLSIIVSAAHSALSALGFVEDEILAMLEQADNDEK